ncbi:protein ALP1-like [Diaphorina citri]|uniref:Protein ALP1-like n=1 Tax=Diaphorina citri TaxID=121845 RepID=A0A3Q0J687_DIACI|nr:protein ALP1-like [Diaphorina citri]
MGVSTVQKIVTDTCKAIVKVLYPDVMPVVPVPTEEMWMNISKEYYELWQFPNCLGALDGKHIKIQAPANSGSLFFNYKKEFSIVLLALVDANYNFTVVEVGALGKESDGGIFAKSNLGQKLASKALSIPPNACLPNIDTEAPHVIVGDEAFPLKSYLLRPYPGNSLDQSKRIFNYRLVGHVGLLKTLLVLWYRNSGFSYDQFMQNQKMLITLFLHVVFYTILLKKLTGIQTVMNHGTYSRHIC